MGRADEGEQPSIGARLCDDVLGRVQIGLDVRQIARVIGRRDIHRFEGVMRPCFLGRRFDVHRALDDARACEERERADRREYGDPCADTDG